MMIFELQITTIVNSQGNTYFLGLDDTISINIKVVESTVGVDIEFLHQSLSEGFS